MMARQATIRKAKMTPWKNDDAEWFKLIRRVHIAYGPPSRVSYSVTANRSIPLPPVTTK
jgi:hypothetical protein